MPVVGVSSACIDVNSPNFIGKMRPTTTLLLLIVAGCTGSRARDPGPPVPNFPAPAESTASSVSLHSISPADRPALIDNGGDGWEALRQAVAHSEEWLAGQPVGRELVFESRGVTAGEMRDALRRFREQLMTDPSPEQLADWVDTHFDVLESAGDEEGDVLVTGYYEPLIEGSRESSPEYPVPVYGVPDDLVQASLGDFRSKWDGERIAGRIEEGRMVPYWTRARIRGDSVLAGRGLEIAWVRDPVDLFFVEVQGSGAIRLPDGEELRIGYAASNGRPYRSIGRLLIDEGKIPEEDISMQSIRRFLAEHPGEIRRVLNHNESFVFFRPLDTPPLGVLGVPVTPERSIATDQRIFPPGALAFLETTRPAVDTSSAEPLRRWVLNQDTGGAIRGPGRVDFFWGRGEEAAEMAGRMKQGGRLFFLVPKAAG